MPISKSTLLPGILLFLCGCQQDVKQNTAVEKGPVLVASDSIASSESPVTADTAKPTAIEEQCLRAGLIDVHFVDTTIRVDLKYSQSDNFICQDLYGDFNKCYLQPDVAGKLHRAQEILHERFPFYSLLVFDAVRPRSVQALMWDTIAVPRAERSKYVSNPMNGSLHNFGAAVDLSIIDENGIELDMGTSYDYFGELAYPREEERLLQQGKLSHLQAQNRQLLRSVMIAAGFAPITTEWWHFNSCSRNEAYTKYRLVE